MDDKIFKVLKEDHDIQRKLFDEITKTAGDSPQRRAIFKELVSEIKRHAKYEERHFYKPLFDHDDTQLRARKSVAEHQEIDDKIEDLKRTHFSSTGWLTKMKTLQNIVLHHLNVEEQEVFPMAGRELAEQEKFQLAQEYNKEILATAH